jgi:toxin ParE1/3/4
VSVFLSPAAQEDLAEIFAYIADHNPRAAHSVVASIKSYIIALQQFPEKGRIGSILNTRELILPNLPYIVPYRLVQNDIEIIRIYHTSRHPLS